MDAPYTEVANFAGKLNYDGQRFNGNVVDFFVSPHLINGYPEKFAAFMEGAVRAGFFQMQMNVLDSRTLRDAREHFGFLGASYGAYAEYLSVIGDNFDLAAWYTFCGGGAIEPGTLMNKWAQNGTADLPLRLLLVSEGEYDDRQAPELSVMQLHYYGGKFTEDNVVFRLVPGWRHEDHSYLVGLFNTLQLFFRETEGIHGEDITG